MVGSFDRILFGKIAMNISLPTLYKLLDTGSVMVWNIMVEDSGTTGTSIVTTWGVEGGAVQETRDYISQGKNIGKSNETSPFKQAQSEAESRWTKQQKAKGYIHSREAALVGQRSDLIRGGIDVMLAHKYRDHAKKIQWPAYVQRKYDGIRCAAVIENGICTLWSRTRKPITGVPHIARHLTEKLANQNIVLDGELYVHSLKSDFEKIISYVRQEAPKPGHEVVQYHVYDVVMDGDFSARTRWLQQNMLIGEPIILAETKMVESEDDMLYYFQESLADGYEGCMVRNSASRYEGKRSYGLQKVKEMQDAEFIVVGVEEGRGKMAGKAIFVCLADNGTNFSVKMKGSLGDLVKYIHNPSLAIGKRLTVQFQNLSVYGIPRFPVGLRLRDDL